MFMLWLIYGVRKAQQNTGGSAGEMKGISVLIPFRNEAHNLPRLLNSLSEIKYPRNKVEFIFIDDHSEDNGVELINKFADESLYTVFIHRLTKEKGKKRALDKGIQLARFPYIVTTDADCVVPFTWLKKYNIAFTDSPFVLAPVVEQGTHFVSKIKEAESVLLAGTLIGSAKNKFPLLASGANLGYKKSLYKELSPYEDNWEIASGDDMFFLDKITQKKKSFTVLESCDALVYTTAKKTYSEVVQQSIRWSDKTKYLKNKRFGLIGILLIYTNLLMAVALIRLLCCGNVVAFGFLYTKFMVDYLFYLQIRKQLKLKSAFLYFFLLDVLYPFHLLIIFVASIFVTVRWKQRKVY